MLKENIYDETNKIAKDTIAYLMGLLKFVVANIDDSQKGS
jgi:hypothetical protein